MTVRRFAVVGDPRGALAEPRDAHRRVSRARPSPPVRDGARATAAELARTIDALRRGEFDGLNLTVPHKEQGLAIADAADESARAIGAANTLVRGPDGRITAHNTDAPALAAELRRLASPETDWAKGRALVLGSGGAARAAIAACAALGVRDIAAVRARAFDDPAEAGPVRRVLSGPDRGAAVARRRGERAAHPSGHPSDERRDEGGRSGERGRRRRRMERLSREALVAIDVVYVPRDTPFLTAARARGLRADDGLGMLARQGALAFELWLGVPAPFEAMLGALRLRFRSRASSRR